MRGITPQKEHPYPDLRQDGVANRFAACVSMIRLNLKRAFRRAHRDFACAGNRWGRLCGKLLHRLNDSSWPGAGNGVRFLGLPRLIRATAYD
jgi:hypothetical protein